MTILRPWVLAALLVVAPAGAGVAQAAVVGTGTPASCTSAAVVSAVARGGLVTFDCGPAPVTIRMRQTAKVRNTNPSLVIDGGGRVTLSGGGARRILYQNTCDRAQVWTTDHCQNQATPRLVVRNITLASGNATGQTVDGGGGGAIFVRGGRLTVVDARFTGNRCDRNGPDVGGGDPTAQPVPQSAREGRAQHLHRGPLRLGGALSSIGVSWVITGSTFTGNRAIGGGANPARAATPGGGNGGAIYLDGNRFTLTMRDTLMEDNVAPEGGGAIFFVSNDRTGTAVLAASTLRHNPSLGFETAKLPGIFFLERAVRPSSRAPS